MEKQTLPNSTLTLVLGILSIIGCCCYGLPGILFGVIAIVLANNAKKIYNEAPENYSGYENVKAGKVMGIIGVVLSLLFVIGIFWMISTLGLSLEDLQNQELLQEKLNELQNK